MSLLNLISKGKTPKPPIILLYGQEGVGKSTFAAKAPGTIFIPTEDGLNEIDCNKFTIAKNYNEFKAYLDSIQTEPHEFQTLAIDSISATERMLFRHICERYGVDNILDAKGGYGKGYKEYTSEWQEIFDKIARIRNERGMSVILVGHCDLVRVFSSRIGQYDQFQPRLYKKAMDILIESADGVFFATRKVRAEKTDAGFGKVNVRTVAIGENGGERIMVTDGGGIDGPQIAKRRFQLPDELPLDWNAFMGAWRAVYDAEENTKKELKKEE